MRVIRCVARLPVALRVAGCVLFPSACGAPARSDSEPIDFTTSALRAADVGSTLAGPVDASAQSDAPHASFVAGSFEGRLKFAERRLVQDASDRSISASSRGSQATVELDLGFTELTLGTVGEPVAACAEPGVPLCQVGPALAPSCSMGVCSKDPFCCNTYWDALCVTEASERVADCPCTHAFDTPGLRLARGCDDPEEEEQDCPFAVCDFTIGDAYCCDTYWDSICVGHAAGLPECED